MKTNRQFDVPYYFSPKKRRLMGKSKAEASKRDWLRYLDDVDKSDSFEVGHYPDLDLGNLTGHPMVVRMYDSSSHTDANLKYDMLLCLSKLAICFYNIQEDTCFGDVKLIMATKSGIRSEFRHITFEAFTSSTTGERVAVTFQTKLVVLHPTPPRFEILFVRIKPPNPVDNESENSQQEDQPPNPVHNESENSQQDQPSEFDSKAQISQQRLSQVIETYTLDSQLDSQYNLALYLSQYALVSHDYYMLSGLVVAKHDIELLKVVELLKPVAEDPTYLITFKAPLRSKSMRKKFYTFKAEICMPELFPTTKVHLISGPEVITGV